MPIPILDRLSFRDYQSLIFAIVFFLFESVMRVLVLILPKFALDIITSFIETSFPWLADAESHHVSPLEKAEGFEKMVKHWKHYNCEQHLVRTKDDYLLCAHRIPSLKNEREERLKQRQRLLKKPIQQSKGVEIIDNLDQFIPQQQTKITTTTTTTEKQKEKKQYTGKPVVLLYHGFLMSSEVWVSNIDEYSNLPFILANKGYDVWLGNARGNKYSQYHVHLSPRHKPFWNFSMNELAMRDLPDTVDYILEQTGAPTLTYIGFSQGTAQAFAGLAANARLNKKVNLFIAMAPATTPKGLHHPLIDAFVKATPSVIYLLFGRKSPLKLALFWQRIIPPPLFVRVIDSSCNFLFGWTGDNMAMDQKMVSYQHLYSLTSVKTLVHWFQIIRSGKFQMYDEMPSRLPYHSVNAVADHIPPRFPTLQITTPIAIFYGRSDSLVDFNLLASDLPSPLVYVKSIEKWEHLDFLWAENIEKIVYPDVVKLLETFNPHYCQKEGLKNDSDESDESDEN